MGKNLSSKYIQYSIFIKSQQQMLSRQLQTGCSKKLQTQLVIWLEKIINLLDNTNNQPSKFRTKNWIEVNDDVLRTYIANSQIKFKNHSNQVCDYSDMYILVKWKLKQSLEKEQTIAVDRNKQGVFQNMTIH